MKRARYKGWRHFMKLTVFNFKLAQASDYSVFPSGIQE
jgi:hypothetical protein